MRRIRRHLASRDLSIKRRSAVVLALATAGALTVAGIALAAPPTSTVPGFSFAPVALPPLPGGGAVCSAAGNYGPAANGKLSVHTNTSYTPPVGNNFAGGATTRMRLFFDDDFCFNTNAVPKCNSANISGNKTLKQAVDACGASKISVSPSTAQFSANGNFTVNACVLVFNGQGAASEALVFMRLNVAMPSIISCASPSTNTQGNTTVLLKGDLRANPNGAPIVGPPGDYAAADACSAPYRTGCELDINNITTASPLPLVDLNIRIKKNNYIRARCVDPPNGNRKLNLQTLFDYVPIEPSQTVDSLTACN